MRALSRLGVSLGVGLLSSVLAWSLFSTEREAIVLVGWSAFCLSWLLVVWGTIRHRDGECSRELATREDDGRAVSGGMLVTGALLSLFGVALALGKAGELQKSDPRLGFALSGLAFATVVLTWLVIQTLYTLHYAHLFYEDPVGGVQFEGCEGLPSYTEFAYLSFTIGMTYQVSDTNLSKRTIRRVLLHHALLSYLFATVLVALTINAVAGLVGGGH